MPSLIFNAAVRNVATGVIDFDTDTFWAMLTTSTYTENKDTHDFRDDVTNEVTGTGYTAGGKVIPVSVAAVDTANDRVVVTIGPVDWTASTITARKMVVYKRRGGAATADELVFVNDFGSDVISASGTFTVAANTITFQN
jgi:hypothetical protein